MRIAVGLLLAGVLGIACSGRLPHPPYIQQPAGALVAIAVAPPPARVEHVPDAPKERGAVWLDGEWTMKRGRWAWTLGRWVVPPVGAGYSPWTFSRASDGRLFFAPGVWRDASGKAIDPPAALRTATADSVAIIDPEGNTELTGRTVRAATSASAAPATSAAPAASAAAPE
jgi:hypothetical protein